MAALRKRLLPAIALALATPLAAQEAEPAPFLSTPEAALQAAQDCAAATSRVGVSEDELVLRGWERAKNVDAIADPAEIDALPIRFYTKGGENPLIFRRLATPEEKRQCVVSGQVEDADAYRDMVLAFTNAFGPPTSTSDSGTMIFSSFPHAIALTRKRDENSAVFVVLVLESGE
ncbi:MAG: hypothetical protein U0995_02550 [Erythrobacter sp.]|nr:hypothetical protein [Erythrobacter sp.]